MNSHVLCRPFQVQRPSGARIFFFLRLDKWRSRNWVVQFFHSEKSSKATPFSLLVDRTVFFSLFSFRDDEQVLICDALNLPYRDESFDAALSIAVIQ